MKASKSQFKEFLSSTAWQDIEDILNERIESTREELEAENYSPIEAQRVSNIRGRLSELKYIKAIPKFLEGNYDKLKEVDMKMTSEEEE